MSDTRGQQEPSMEEILASIRRIISEEGEAPAAPEVPAPPPAEPDPAPPAMEPPALPAVEPDVLVLTQVVTEDDSGHSLSEKADGDLVVAPPLPEPPAEAAPQATTMENEAVTNASDRPSEMVSGETAATSTTAFGELARAVARSRDVGEGGGRTLEDLALEAMTPMIRQWLDAHLPGLVERLVRKEVERLARRAEDDL